MQRRTERGKTIGNERKNEQSRSSMAAESTQDDSVVMDGGRAHSRDELSEDRGTQSPQRDRTAASDDEAEKERVGA